MGIHSQGGMELLMRRGEEREVELRPPLRGPELWVFTVRAGDNAVTRLDRGGSGRGDYCQKRGDEDVLD